MPEHPRCSAQREWLLPETGSYLLQLPHEPAAERAGGSRKVTVPRKGVLGFNPSTNRIKSFVQTMSEQATLSPTLYRTPSGDIRMCLKLSTHTRPHKWRLKWGKRRAREHNSKQPDIPSKFWVGWKFDGGEEGEEKAPTECSPVYFVKSLNRVSLSGI